MASFLERAQNLIDDHQDQRAATDSANQKAQALYTVRDNLLAKSMDLYHSYRDELAVAAGPAATKAIHTDYDARFAGINDAFTVLRQSDPGITTQIDPEQFRLNAERQAEQQARLRSYEQALPTPAHEHSRSLASGGPGSGFSY
jgi:hypothetical protein